MPRTLAATALLAALAPVVFATHQTDAANQPRQPAAATVLAPVALPTVLSDSAFAELSRTLSEPGGHFDSDNLVSNETSYLHVLGSIQRAETRGGVYVGVGPDQGFSYIAAVRADFAFALDIRRDNALVHLLYKAAFEEARNRVEYLALLFGRPVPPDVGAWDDRPIEEIVGWISAEPASLDAFADARARLRARVTRLPLPLSEEDLGVIDRVHQTFAREGLGIRYSSIGRPPRPYYPTYGQLVLERDRDGNVGSYLASVEGFRHVQQLQRRNLIVPVVGDLAGPRALAAIGRWTREQGGLVSLFYASNVEYYLARERKLDAFGRNLATLPHDAQSVLVRSLFRGTYGMAHPHSVPGHLSTQLASPLAGVISAFGNGEYVSYRDIVARPLLEP